MHYGLGVVPEWAWKYSRSAPMRNVCFSNSNAALSDHAKEQINRIVEEDVKESRVNSLKSRIDRLQEELEALEE